jgi:hypothetical protein
MNAFGRTDLFVINGVNCISGFSYKLIKSLLLSTHDLKTIYINSNEDLKAVIKLFLPKLEEVLFLSLRDIELF